MNKTDHYSIFATLSYANAVLEKFNQNDVLCELDGLLKYCRDNEVSEEQITDINVKTLKYIKNCNIKLTKKYLKDQRNWDMFNENRHVQQQNA